MNPIQYMHSREKLLGPASSQDIQNTENKLHFRLPKQLREFLLWADGGVLPGERVIIYSAGTGIHPEETLIEANKNRGGEIPLLFFAREAEEEFVFRIEDIEQENIPVYVYQHEEGTLKYIADSFVSFVKWAIRLGQ